MAGKKSPPAILCGLTSRFARSAPAQGNACGLKKGKPFVSYRGKGGKRILALLNCYLKGKEVDFSSLSLGLGFLPPFTQRVLAEVRKIPYGEVVSYGEIAENIGDRRKARGVGVALEKNPFPVIIPCHRVIRKDGKLGGFSLGVRVKKWLLEREGFKIKGKRVVKWKGL